jgi:ribonucleoside-diphosphate reductase alpha chain
VRNPHLQKVLAGKGMGTQEIWQSVIEHEDSVHHLAGLNDEEKAIYRTAFELD